MAHCHNQWWLGHPQGIATSMQECSQYLDQEWTDNSAESPVRGVMPSVQGMDAYCLAPLKAWRDQVPVPSPPLCPQPGPDLGKGHQFCRSGVSFGGSEEESTSKLIQVVSSQISAP